MKIHPYPCIRGCGRRVSGPQRRCLWCANKEIAVLRTQRRHERTSAAYRMTQRILKTIFAPTAAILFFGTTLHAQGLTVSYDYALTGSETLAMVQGWTPTLYVNGTAFPASHTCVAQPAPAVAVTCTFPLPNVSSAITASGDQRFEVSLKDPIVGEGGKSSPFIRVRPHAPTNSRTP